MGSSSDKGRQRDAAPGGDDLAAAAGATESKLVEVPPEGLEVDEDLADAAAAAEEEVTSVAPPPKAPAPVGAASPARLGTLGPADSGPSLYEDDEPTGQHGAQPELLLRAVDDVPTTEVPTEEAQGSDLDGAPTAVVVGAQVAESTSLPLTESMLVSHVDEIADPGPTSIFVAPPAGEGSAPPPPAVLLGGPGLARFQEQPTADQLPVGPGVIAAVPFEEADDELAIEPADVAGSAVAAGEHDDDSEVTSEQDEQDEQDAGAPGQGEPDEVPDGLVAVEDEEGMFLFRAAPPKREIRWPLLAGVGIVAVGLAIGVALYPGGEDAPGEAATAEPAQRPQRRARSPRAPQQPAAARARPQPAPPPPPAPRMVRIELKAEPEAATLTIDGDEVPNPYVGQRPASDRTAKVVVEAPGHVRKELALSLIEGGRWVIALEPATPRRPPDAGAPRADGAARLSQVVTRVSKVGRGAPKRRRKPPRRAPRGSPKKKPDGDDLFGNPYAE